MMEEYFAEANSSNLPKIDLITLGEFLASNKEFCASEFQNVTSSMALGPSYVDATVRYVQVKREENICFVKCKILPENEAHVNFYAVTLTVDEDEKKVTSIQCHHCVAAQGGCRHATALLMWIHRKSEEPSSTEVQCYCLK